MSRRVKTGIALATVTAVAVLGTILSSGGSDEERYSVDVIFDDARGLVPGQLVQIAGADVGTIDAVSVTRDFKARIHLDIDGRFAPFRKDATCTIKSKGLIAENYVQCDPGTPDSPELKASGDTAPTVPVDRTTQPVSLVDLFEIWNAPTRQRTQILLSTLGVSVAGRGEDINETIRRANPSLGLARETIGILERQRAELAQTVDATSEVASALARRPEELAALVRHGSRVTAQTADHREALGAGVRRLPPLLREATPALQKLDATMDAGQPLLDQLSAAAPDVNRVSADVPQLASTARPTLRKLQPALRDGAATARRSKPLLALMEKYAADSLPSARTAGVMFPELEKRGFVKDLFGFFYNLAVGTARYDEVSHVLPAHVSLSECSMPADEPSAECGGPAAPEESSKRRAKKRRRGGRSGGSPSSATATPSTPATPASPAPSSPVAPAPATPAPVVPSVPDPAPSAPPVEQLLDFLLG